MLYDWKMLFISSLKLLSSTDTYVECKSFRLEINNIFQSYNIMVEQEKCNTVQ